MRKKVEDTRFGDVRVICMQGELSCEKNHGRREINRKDLPGVKRQRKTPWRKDLPLL